MWILAVMAGIGALFFWAASPDGKPQVPSCPRAGTKILLIGDSLAEGLGPQLQALAAACGTSFSYQAMRGSHVTQWLALNWPDIQPDIVLISLGGNDYQRTDPINVQNAIKRLVSSIEAEGGRVLWIAPPRMPYEDTIGVKDMWLDVIGRSSGDWLNTEEIPYQVSEDRVHPTPQGFRMLASVVWRWLAGRTQ